MRLFVILLGLLFATFANAQSTAELKAMLHANNDACGTIAFKETAEMVQQADEAYAKGALQDVDRVMDNIYDTYYDNEVHYLSLKGESERLRNILTQVKAKMLQIDNLDDTTSIKELVRSADIRLNMCDIEGAHSIIADLRTRLRL